MCGRFLLTLDFDTMMDVLNGRFQLPPSFNIDYRPRYNIAPTTQVLTLIQGGETQRLGYMKWGFVPPWAADDTQAGRLINARSETASEKPTFKQSFLQSRCLILANGFYEWKKSSTTKQPMLIQLKNNRLFTMAGLYSVYRPSPTTKMGTCTILTASPNELISPIHHRMPVILKEEDEKRWLSPKLHPQELKELLQPYDSHLMSASPISNRINSVKHNDPSCIEPATVMENTSLDLSTLD